MKVFIPADAELEMQGEKSWKNRMFGKGAQLISRIGEKRRGIPFFDSREYF